MTLEDKMLQIFEKFNKREDNCLWDLQIVPEGNLLKIHMETNEAYLRGRNNIFKICLDKEVGIDEEDYMDVVFPNTYVS